MSFGIPVRNGLGIGLAPSTAISSGRIGGRPALVLNFVNTTALDSRITFTRSTTATVTNSSGVIQSSAINSPRFDYDPVTLAPKGLLIEDQRVNLLLNSLIDGTSLSTQSVTVTAVAHTISFYGTGTITLTGASIATVTGTGVYPSRKTLTFTPIVGVLVCTVTGSVQYAQLEAGVFASSFIPTAGSSVTRAPDIARMTGTDFSSWYNATEGTFVVNADVLAVNSTVQQNPISLYTSATNLMRFWLWEGAPTFVRWTVANVSTQADIVSGAQTANTPFKAAAAYKLNDFAASYNGAAALTDTAGTVPVGFTQFNLGSQTGSFGYLNGHLRSVVYYNTRVPNTTLQVLTV